MYTEHQIQQKIDRVYLLINKESDPEIIEELNCDLQYYLDMRDRLHGENSYWDDTELELET